MVHVAKSLTDVLITYSIQGIVKEKAKYTSVERCRQDSRRSAVSINIKAPISTRQRQASMFASTATSQTFPYSFPAVHKFPLNISSTHCIWSSGIQQSCPAELLFRRLSTSCDLPTIFLALQTVVPAILAAVQHSRRDQPLASPDLDPASKILVEKCIRKKRSPEPETECIHFVDVNDITDNEGFFEDETEVIKLDSLYDLNPDLGVLVPLDLDTLIHPDPNLIKDIPLDFCLDDINLILKEADLTLNTLKLNSEDSDLILSPAEMTQNNSDLILDNSDGNVNNLEWEVSQTNLLLGLNPDSCDLKSLDLRVMTKPDLTENISINPECINLTSNNSELILEDEQPIIFWKSIFGVAPLDLYSTVCVLPDVTYLATPCTDFNIRESLSPFLPVASLTIVPASVPTLPHLLSPIPAGDSLGYPIMVMSHDPSPYHIPDSYFLPSISSSSPIKDHLNPSWMTLLDYTTVAGRLTMTLAETSYKNALVAKDVFIAPPTPFP
ncbi:hypothetical protein M5K25_009144 [Dendrobium thyrsiflorum]|uniref:Uncharacterized protein n=1 Tax=Dendrobium thyrsiflorum TaxID=117978 RepID=A0ABD0VC61_DENTH